MPLIASLFTSLLGWIFRISTVKFLVFGALSLLLVPLMSLIMSLIDSAGLNEIGAQVNSMPAALLYFLKLFRMEVGIPMMVAAMLVKFFIRRLPVVG